MIVLFARFLFGGWLAGLQFRFASSQHFSSPIFSRESQDARGRFQRQCDESAAARWTRAVNEYLFLPRSAPPTLPASPQSRGHSAWAAPEEPELQNRGTFGTRPVQPREHRLWIQAGARVCKYNAKIYSCAHGCWCSSTVDWFAGFVKDPLHLRSIHNRLFVRPVALASLVQLRWM